MYTYNMGLFKEVELIIPPKKTNETIRVKSFNGYDANNSDNNNNNNSNSNNK